MYMIAHFNPHLVKNDLRSNILWSATERPCLAAKPNLLSKAKVNQFHIPSCVQEEVLRLQWGGGEGRGGDGRGGEGRGEEGRGGEGRGGEERRWGGKKWGGGESSRGKVGIGR